jgi:DNA replication and repair protein RecF
MKIAVITYLEERYHFAPILLLDDVSSELDRQRNRQLFDFLRQRDDGQVFITTTHRDFIHLDEDLKVFEVDDGNVIDA